MSAKTDIHVLNDGITLSVFKERDYSKNARPTYKFSDEELDFILLSAQTHNKSQVHRMFMERFGKKVAYSTFCRMLRNDSKYRI